MKHLAQVGALACLAALACKPAPGRACNDREAHCLDARRALVCDDGQLIETPCRGKGGCSTVQDKTSCDITGNQPGDACSRQEEGIAACTNPESMLACHGRKYELVPCRGPRGCETVAGQPSCDQSIAEPGEACKASSAKACSADKSRVLSCADGRMTELYACRGDGECRAEAGKLSCDQTRAKLADRCDKGLKGHIACSEDGTSLLVCEGERFVASEKCKPGTVCVVSRQSTRCEKP